MNKHLVRTRSVIALGRLWLALMLPVLFSVLAWSQEYTVTNLGTLGGATSQAYAINNLGHVTGLSLNSKGIWFPFLYSNGTTKAIATDIYTVFDPSAVFSPYRFTPYWPTSAYGPVAIDENDHVALNAYTDEPNAFLWINGQLEFIGGGEVYDTPYVNGMNANDVAVGLPDPFEVDFTIPVIYYGTTSEAVIPMGSYAGLNAIAINNSKQIAATCVPSSSESDEVGPACLVKGNSIKLLGLLRGSAQDYPNAINSAGNICGLSTGGSLGTSTTATYWWGLTPVNLGTPKNTSSSQCLGMDDYGAGVGLAQKSPSSTVGVLFDPVSGAQDLNVLAAPSRGRLDLVIQNAVAVSDTGFIAANCLYLELQNKTEQHACLLTPNWAAILRDSIVAQAKGDPGCVQCKTELEPEAESLPSNFTGLSQAEWRKAEVTVENIKSQLAALGGGGQINEQATCSWLTMRRWRSKPWAALNGEIIVSAQAPDR